ncbi:putative phosphatidylglycerol/phosphatidylinositol transfer protein DDB_G0282179 [Gossypium hirsutum]|uniref:Phosphatidylglycerol/phosphatidylinositol transfer protein DDB_G0282179 n=1 Tax=Gossypium hirsutum TaxID=3635 RepID=A0A1U8KPC1_GOSHI|nr:putative phosphatidylglycerol/phosphatidylinositol transfer protein DDB_G0282179 [Gossypium hirsutum]
MVRWNFEGIFFFPCNVLVFGETMIEINANNKGNYVVKVDGVDISPNPVISGKPATFTISASTGQAITGGKAVIEVYFFGFHIHQETHDLCEETSCPITIGNFVLSYNQVLPGFTPPGSYKLKMTLSGARIKQLTCISFDFKINFGASESSVSDSLSAHQVYI